MARYLVKTVLPFALFGKGERLLVREDFLARYGRWLKVISPIDEASPPDVPEVEEIVEEGVDGNESEDRRSEA
jgi:hypothetical protein